MIVVLPLVLDVLILKKDRWGHAFFAYLGMVLINGVGFGFPPYSNQAIYSAYVDIFFISAFLVVGFGIVYSVLNYGWRWFESSEFLFYATYAFTEYMLLLPLYSRVVLLN